MADGISALSKLRDALTEHPEELSVIDFMDFYLLV